MRKSLTAAAVHLGVPVVILKDIGDPARAGLRFAGVQLHRVGALGGNFLKVARGFYRAKHPPGAPVINMASKSFRRAIEKRIRWALQSLKKGDMTAAMFNISSVVGVVARQRYKNTERVEDRIKAFLFDEQHLIYFLSTRGRVSVPDGVRVVVAGINTHKPGRSRKDELADLICHNIRSAQEYGAPREYGLIDFGRHFGLGRLKFAGDGGELAPGVFIVSNATVLALILAVICASENRGIKLPGNINLYNKVVLDKHDLVGSKDYLKDKLRGLFTPTHG